MKRTVGTPAHLKVARRASRRSITLLRNDAGLLPLTPDTGQKALVTGFGVTTTATLGAAVEARGLPAQVLDTGFDPEPAQIAEAVAAAQQSDVVFVSTFNAWTPGVSQIALVNALLATGKPVVVTAVGTPYDVAYLPNAPTFITSLDYQPPSLEAMVEAIFGEVDPTGKLPVTVREPPPSKGVLYPFGYGAQLPLAQVPRGPTGRFPGLCAAVRPVGGEDLGGGAAAAAQGALHQAVPLAGGVLAGEVERADRPLQVRVADRRGEAAGRVGAAHPGVLVPAGEQRRGRVGVEVEVGAQRRQRRDPALRLG